jgi:hypothetical protein
VQSADAGIYTVLVTNASGSVTSQDATLTVTSPLPPPAITGQPQNVAANVGETATFTVSATGTGILGYQWYFNDNALTGETASTLTIANVSAANEGSYMVIVTNSIESVISSSATLTVTTDDDNDDDDDDNGNGGDGTGGGDGNNTNPGIAAPVVVTAPADTYAREGGTATFTVTATGANRTYEWLHNGTIIEGATAATLTLTQVLLDDAGSYQVRVTNAGGSDTSEPATLTVTGYDLYGLTTKGAKLTAPKFDKKTNPLAPKTKQTLVWTVDYDDGNGAQPLTNKGKAITAASFTAKADGHYIAYYNYTPANATGPVTVLAADFGWVQVFPALKFHKTEGLLITEQVTPVPSVKNGVVIADGEFTGLTAKLQTEPEVPVIYTWFDGKNVIRESKPTFSQTDYLLYGGLTAKSKISVSVRTGATDAKGKPLSLVKSKTLALKAILPPVVTITTKAGSDGVASAFEMRLWRRRVTITTKAGSDDVVRVVAGKALSLKTKVTGTAKFTYQWQYRTTADAEWETLVDSPKGTVENAVSGAAKSTLSVKSVTSAVTGQYRVIVTNAAGTAHAATAIISVEI